MSKITNDGLTRSDTGCFIPCSCAHMATMDVKGLMFACAQAVWHLWQPEAAL